MSDFIPKPYKKDAITIRVSIEKLETIDALAAKYDISRSAFINQCIEFAMEHMPKPEEN